MLSAETLTLTRRGQDPLLSRLSPVPQRPCSSDLFPPCSVYSFLRFFSPLVPPPAHTLPHTLKSSLLLAGRSLARRKGRSCVWGSLSAMSR